MDAMRLQKRRQNEAIDVILRASCDAVHENASKTNANQHQQHLSKHIDSPLNQHHILVNLCWYIPDFLAGYYLRWYSPSPS